MYQTDHFGRPASRNQQPLQSAANEPFAKAQGIAGEAIVSMIRDAVHRFVVSRRERKALGTLRGLDDRQLADIGVSRSEIPHIARTVAEYPTMDYRTVQRI